jgi:pimeloyl-ACP methyl ester carboxylesterase
MGDHDKLFLSPVKKIKERFNNIKLEIIKNAGHVCNAHKPEEFNEISLDFLAKA